MRTVSVEKALERYRKSVSILKKGYEQECYRIAQLSRSFLGAMTVREVTSVHVAKYRDERLAYINPRTQRQLSPASVRLELSLLSNFFDISRFEWGYCRENPCANVRKPPTAPARERRPTPRELSKIIHYAKTYANRSLWPIIILALETGMRQGEILGLVWENIDMQRRVAHLPHTKNGSKRDTPLSLVAREALLFMLQTDTATSGKNRSAGRVFNYTSPGLKTAWRIMCQTLKIEDLHFHDLRHEAISRFFEKGRLDIMEVAAISGHKSLSQLKRYTHLRAHKLVRKLDGNNSKIKQAILTRLLPYPALLESTADEVQIRFLDFDNLTVTGVDIESARRAASARLLEIIVKSILDERITLPNPDQYLENVKPDNLILIEPFVEAEEDPIFL